MTPDLARLDIAVLGDEDLVSGMRLAGVRRARVVEGGAEEVQRELSALIGDPSVGIIIILEEYAELAADIVRRARETKDAPIMVEVPSKHGTRFGDVSAYYRSYIREFIGFDIEM